MNFLCLLHADFEGMGVIASWIQERKHDFLVVRPFEKELLPSVDPFDCLIVMGGPQSPLKKDLFPYLKDEITVIRQFMDQGKGVIGFCLGAQLLGEACGALAERSPEKEVGIYPVILTDAGMGDPLLKDFPKEFSVMHWHYDMPGLSDESIVLAKSPGCPRQIVRYGAKAYGFQCHLEITQEGLALLTEKAPSDLRASQYTQTKEEILSQPLEAIHQKMYDILDGFTKLLA